MTATRHEAYRKDLKAISIFVEEDRNPATANRICRAIYDGVQVLRRFPLSGKVGFEEGTREWVIPSAQSYIVVYRLLAGDAIQILRVWHGAQDR